ncbi:DUF3293 domain-containing protein [Silvimonas iriomotensis]|uniref:DUF3293 domain-containing protein n=1 Tax=Silvimonas iriomotensis TaxID=449662 RepID=A0ABQ2P6H9_9NEIS|nr:DUF3293 domain-containing protein [Silvimonas iriomotensis]GGP19260.1 hypothetical protein GCM10010970_09730 [Silvimonas iriomotensis]
MTAPDADSRLAALNAAYMATRYVVPALGLTLRVGQHSPELDAVLRQHDAHGWMFISACNPYSRAVLCQHENLARHQNLLDALNTAGLVFFEGFGEGDDGQWPAEPSALVLAVDAPAAAAWGQRFEQNAVLSGTLGGAAGLLWCLPADA